MRRSLPLLLSLAILLPASARADEPTLPAMHIDTSGEAVGHRWYGWQPLLVDAGSIATMMTAMVAGRGPAWETVGIVGTSGYLCGAPLIHLGHEHLGKAAGSFALRLLVPLVGAFTGGITGGIAGHRGSSDSFGGVVDTMDNTIVGGYVGFGLGAAIAATIDDVAIAQEDVHPVVEERGAKIEASVAPVRGGATVGVGGTF